MASRLVLPFADVGSGIKPSSGAKLFFFETGTSTPKDTFSDSAATTPNSSPVISDSTGVFADIFITGTYKVVLKDKNDVQIWEADPVDEFVTGSGQEENVLSRDTLNAAVVDTSLADGLTINLKERTTGGGGGALWDVVLASSVTISPGAPTVGNIVLCTGVPTLALVLRIKGNIYDAVRFGAVAGIDAGPAFQSISDIIPEHSTVTARGITFLINSEVNHTTDNIAFNFFKSKILNTVTLATKLENSQGINPVFFIKANGCSTTGGDWQDFVSQAVYGGGVFNAGDPFDNAFSGFTAHHMKCSNLVCPATQSKFVQTRHINDVNIHHIRCKDMGEAKVGTNASPVSVNYATDAEVSHCSVRGCDEGQAYNLLFVKDGRITKCTGVDIQNTLDPAINVGVHIKESIDIEFSGCNIKTLNGEAAKISENVEDIEIFGNTLETTGTDADIFTVLQLQGVNGFNVHGNTIITDGPRAIFGTVHVSASTKDGKISGNRIFRNVAALQPTSKGSGIWITADTSDRAPIVISDNYLFECDIYANQLKDSHINNNNFTITSPLFYNGFDQLGGAITQISAPITLESCNNTNCKDNSIINTVTAPTGFQVGVRSINSIFCNINKNDVVFTSGALLSFGYADIGSVSSVFKDNLYKNAVGYVQDINNATPAMHFYKNDIGFSVDIGSVGAGASVQVAMVIEMMQISGGNTFLTTKAGLPTQANGLLYEAVFTSNNTVTFTFFNPTGGAIAPGQRIYYLTSERRPI